jgi:hypothetical protein
MRRIVQGLVLSFAAAILTAIVTAGTGCGNQCSRIQDCAAGQFCSQGSCANALLASVHCTADADCAPTSQFRCLSGVCSIRGSSVITSTVTTDAGSGTADSGSTSQDAGAHD